MARCYRKPIARLRRRLRAGRVVGISARLRGASLASWDHAASLPVPVRTCSNMPDRLIPR